MFTIIISVILGITLSVICSFMINRPDLIWGKLADLFLNSEMWEHIFDRMIKKERVKLGQFNFQKTKSHKKKDQDLESSDPYGHRLNEDSLKDWVKPNHRTINLIKNKLKNQGKINNSSIPIKLYLKEVLLSTDFKGMNDYKIERVIISRIYSKIIRTELLQKEGLDHLFVTNEKINFAHGALSTYLLKMGGTEHGVREAILRHYKNSLTRLRKLSPQKIESIEKQISLQMDISDLFANIRQQARLQSKFIREHEAKKEREENERIRQKAEKEQAKKKREEKRKRNLNPQNFNDALEILEITKVVDLSMLKKSYKKMAMKHHPDRFTDDFEQKSAHEKFVKIQKAFETLRLSAS